MTGSLVLAVSLFKQLFDTVGTIVSTALTSIVIIAFVVSVVFALWVWNIMKHTMASARMQPWEKKYPPHDHKHEDHGHGDDGHHGEHSSKKKKDKKEAKSHDNEHKVHH
jgi:uncharacterized protein HemY